jgi:hypothetical protein
VIHPTNVDTDMLRSDPMYRSFRPDLENPTFEDAALTFGVQQAMPIPLHRAQGHLQRRPVPGLR